MDICSRRCHRLITLNSATLITPVSPAQRPSGNGDYTWVKFRCKYLLKAGQYSVQFNTAAGLKPIPQFSVEQYDLDFALIAERRKLAIEVDGERYHRSW